MLRKTRSVPASLLIAAWMPTRAVAADGVISLPVADAQLVGITVAATQTTHGDVTRAVGFRDAKQYIQFDTRSPGGMYRLHVQYRAPSSKGFEVKVDGLPYSGTFPAAPEFIAHDAGLVELPQGQTRITLGGGWGHYEIAGLELTPVRTDPPPRAPASTLVTPNVSAETRDLFARLLGGYGKYTLSGVHEFDDLTYVRQKAGHEIAILSRDLIEYTPSRVEHGSQPGQMTEKAIDAVRAGHDLTLCWHWNAPNGLIDQVEVSPDGRRTDKRWYRGFYTEATTFDVAKALSDVDGDNYKLLLRDIDAIAVELKKLQAAHVPVLWRPLHEAEQGWFWWGARGPEAYKTLWRLLYQRLTQHHGLDNLIWVYTSAGSTDWYPGDDVVDVIGADAYPDDNRDPLTGIWNTLRRSFGDRKLIALSEVGTVPDLDRMRRHGVYWSYFATWNGKLGPRGMEDGELKRRLASPLIRGKPTP